MTASDRDVPTPRRDAIRRPRSLRAEPVPTATALRGVVLGMSAALMLPAAAMAQARADDKKEATPPAATARAPETQLPPVKVQATAIDPNPNAQTGVPYKARTSGDVRHTRPLAETPQTISVITRTAIDDSGNTDLRQILDGQPGITLGTGENGNAFGDRYIIRGQEARSDVFVDGLRDPGMTTRESFAIEQLEISKGPNSSFAGRGTVGGAINAITKQATLDDDFFRASTGFGTDRHVRVTADWNKVLTDRLALRANALHAKEDVPDRAPADRERKGVALSGLFEASKDLSLVLDYYGLRARDMPDLGGYLVGTAPDRGPAPDVPVYAQAQDFLKSDVDAVTARVKATLSPSLGLNSVTRFGTSDNRYVVTGARGINAFRPDGSPYATASLSTHNAWQEVEYLAHQTHLLWNTVLGGMKHEFILGLEYTDHEVVKGSFAIANAGAFNCRNSLTAVANNAFCTVAPSGAVTPGLNQLLNRQISPGPWNADWQIRTLALSAMDTFDISDRLSAFAGVRVDRFDYDLSTRSNAGVIASYDYRDTLVNGHLGLTYRLTPQGIVYASFASATDVNGGESDVGTNSGYGGAVIYNGSIAAAKPETSRNVELGTKWNLLDQKLLATAAVFQTTKGDIMEGANYDSVGTFNTGRNRVRGVELGLTGNVTDALTVQAGLALMDAKVLKSATASNVGKTLSNFADKSASVQVKYRISDGFHLGAAAKYESERCAGQPDTAAGIDAAGLCTQPVPEYTVFDLFGSYRFNKHLQARVNLLNVTDKDHYTAAYRSGAFLYKGDGRALRVTVDYRF